MKGPIETGKFIKTNSYSLKEFEEIIHFVGPVYPSNSSDQDEIDYKVK